MTNGLCPRGSGVGERRGLSYMYIHSKYLCICICLYGYFTFLYLIGCARRGVALSVSVLCSNPFGPICI